jgi:WxcM-like, C-terminal
MNKSGKAKLIQLNGHKDDRGTLSVLQVPAAIGDSATLPFAAKRIYILHGQNQTQNRGAHAHKALRQVIFAMSGQVKVIIDDGQSQSTFYLSSPDEALILEPVIWRDLELSVGAVVAVLASEVYDETDYIRNYDAFLDHIR